MFKMHTLCCYVTLDKYFYKCLSQFDVKHHHYSPFILYFFFYYCYYSYQAVGLSDQQAVEPASRLLLALMDMYRYTHVTSILYYQLP